MAEQTRVAAPARALVIGINEYDDPHIPPLTGCAGDARDVAQYLRETLGLQPEQLRLLISPPQGADEQRPTRAAIIEGIRDFLGGTPPGQEALLYFSGHGSRAQLDERIRYGDERGETFVPADARVGGVLDLLDRELRFLIAELVDKGIRLTLIADSCHAGDVFRSPVAQNQPQPVARLTGPARGVRDRASLLAEVGGISEERLDALFSGPALPYTLIAGAMKDQLSYEIPLAEGGEKRGAMTTALLRVLRQAGGDLTYRELERALRANLPEYKQRARQQPSITGEQDRPLFRAATEPSERRLFAVQKVAGSEIELDGGQIHGVVEGSELLCFADWTLATPQGAWRVTKSFSDRALAEPLEGAPTPAVGQPLRLAQLPARPTVRFHPDAVRVAAAWRDRELKGAPTLVEVYTSEADYTVQPEGESWVVRRRNGSEVEALRHARDAAGHFRVAQQLDRVACYERFRDLAPTDEVLPLSFDAPSGGVALRAEQLDWQGTATALVEGGAPLASGSRLRFTVHNGSARALFINVYRLEPEQHVAQRVWPTDGAEQLESGTQRAAIWQDQQWQGGLLHLKLIVSSTPLNLPVWPCGRGGGMRGPSVTGATALQPRLEGWAVHAYTLGRGAG